MLNFGNNNEYKCTYSVSNYNDVIYIAVHVKFGQSTYNITEDGGPLLSVLLLSNSLPTDLFVQVFSIDVSATGE